MLGQLLEICWVHHFHAQALYRKIVVGLFKAPEVYRLIFFNPGFSFKMVLEGEIITHFSVKVDKNRIIRQFLNITLKMR